MVSSFRRVLAVTLLGVWWTVALATRADATVCGPDATANPILFGCSPFATACTISSGNAPAGCNLDFKNRKVTFTGTFDVSQSNDKASTLTVSAAQIVVQGVLKARADNNRSGGGVELTATDSITITGAIDVSGNSGGLMRLRAGGAVDLPTGGALRAKGVETSSIGNTATGGSINITAGTSFTDRGTIAIDGGPGGGGGSLLVQAGTNIVIQQPIDATGGESDGGDVDFTAGDDIRLERNIDVSSNTGGGGGGITARAGVDRVGGVKIGGELVVIGDMTANGNSDADGGWDGGDIMFRSFGPSTISGALRAVGGTPDGSGGSVSIDTSDNLPARVTALDGDLVLSSIIDVHGPNGGGESTAAGGDVDLLIGRDGTVTGSMDLSGSDDGGALTGFIGRSLSFGAIVNAKGTYTEAGGGSVFLETGRGLAGSLSVTRTLDVSTTAGPPGGVTLKGCGLSLAGGLMVNAKNNRQAPTPRIDLVSASTLTVGASGSYLADPAGRVALIHPAGTPPQIGTNVTFSPTKIDVVDPTQFPNCSVCGDGVRQLGEPCDKGAGADGICCNADCSAFTCATITPTPTVTPTSTIPTKTATPTRTRTPTPTTTPIPTVTVPITGPTAIATPILPFIEPRAVLDCEKTVGKATSTLALTTLKTLETCGLEAFKCLHTKAAGSDRNACYASTGRRCNAKFAKLDAAHARYRTQFLNDCGGEPPQVPIELLRSTDVLGFARLQPQCFGLDLQSPDAILGCLQILGPCEMQRAVGVAIPRIGDLLGLVGGSGGDSAACLPPPLGVTEGLAGSPAATQAVRCQRTVAAAGRKLVSRQLSVARSCVDTLLKCRLSGKPREVCEKTSVSCGRKLAALDHPSTGARAKMLGAIHAACGTLPPDVVRDAIGIGYEATDTRCSDLGVGPPTDVAGVATCVTRAYTCVGSDLVREALPLIDNELARMSLDLGNDAFCALPTPTATATPILTATATPTPTSTPLATSSATPTATSTPVDAATTTPTSTPAVTATGATGTPPPTETPTPDEPATPTVTPSPSANCADGIVDAGEQCDFGDGTPGDGCDALCRFELLVPGGGAKTNDCIGEWAIVNPFNVPFLGSDDLPSTKQTCVDGDPTCDADGAADDRCTFRTALCLQNVDPNLGTCTAPPGIAKFVLVSPRPNSSDDADAANAIALLDGFGRLSATAPSGSAKNTLVFDPPLVLAAPDNCTAPTELVVERRGLSQRSEKFRVKTTSVPPVGGTRSIDDTDSLLLVCLAAPDPTPTATPIASGTPTPQPTTTP